MNAPREQGLVALAAGAALSSTAYGLKASWLSRACQAGERVPEGFCIDAASAALIAAGDHATSEALRAQLGLLQQASPAQPLRLAVRASPSRSLPGALLTLLDVPCDLDTVRAALHKVLSSQERPSVREQLAATADSSHGVPSADQRALAHERPWLGVLVQRYLPVASGGDFGAVVFTRDPATGERSLRGEYSALGTTDVVSGRARTRPLEPAHTREAGDTLAAHDPSALAQIKALAQRLDLTFDQPLELELAYTAGELWLLQVRALVLSPRGLVKVALDAIDEDSSSYARHLLELARRGLASFSEQHLGDTGAAPGAILTRGVAASMGAAVGVVVTDVQRAIERAQHEPVVLLRPDAIPEDIAAFRVARAVVTTSGGLTCHAAVIARGLGVPAVVGCTGVRIDLAGRQLWGGRDAAHVVLREGDWVSVDARRGLLYGGQLPLEVRIRDAELRRLFVEIRKLRPTPLWVEGDAQLALQLKEDACLDGALCSWPSHGALPAGRGRECWIQIDASEVAARVGTLPSGWGVVVTGDLSGVRMAALRKLAPLRALGLRLDSQTQLAQGGFDERLDLLVVGPDFSGSGGLAEPAGIDTARVLRAVSFPELAAVPIGNNVGWVCPASHVAVAALRYATVRAGSTLDSPGRLAMNSLADGGEP